MLLLSPCSGSENTAKYVERGGHWHHLAVTWSVDDDGLTKIYWDGLLMAEAITRKTKPLEQGGAFMLGAEQVRGVPISVSVSVCVGGGAAWAVRCEVSFGYACWCFSSACRLS